MKFSEIYLKTIQNKPKVIRRDTRQWTGGLVRFAVIGVPKHPETNYILFEKDFFGRSKQLPQRFILHSHDWQNLKRLIDGDLIKETKWMQPQTITKATLEKILAENPDFIETILKVPNITKFSQTSLEVLDRLAIRIFEIKRENIDLILKRLGESRNQELITLASLLKDLKLNQVSTLSSLVYQKLKIIDLLENLTSNREINEDKVHELFKNNIWLCGKNFEIVQSDKPLSTYLSKEISKEPETQKRPDLIVKRIPYTEEIILIELKAPGIKLKAESIFLEAVGKFYTHDIWNG